MKHEINDLTLVVSIEGDGIHIAKAEKNLGDGIVKVVETGRDVTSECIKAVMEHMLSKLDDNTLSMAYTIDGKCELMITDLRDLNK